MQFMFNADYKKIAENISEFIKKTVKQAGFSKVIVAVSGGVDSSVAATLSKAALGRENVLVTLLPYGDLNSQGSKDAHLIIKKLFLPQKNISEIDIKKAVDEISRQAKGLDKMRKGNIMARVRMIYLYDLAKKHKALVVGTENKTEYLLGYFTRFGDDASDLEPVRTLYKTQVIALAKFLNVPQPIIAKAPSAGLWRDQTDEGEFGFTYREADKILYLKFDKNLSIDEIIKQGIEKHVANKVLSRVANNAFKHKVPIVF